MRSRSSPLIGLALLIAASTCLAQEPASDLLRRGDRLYRVYPEQLGTPRFRGKTLAGDSDQDGDLDLDDLFRATDVFGSRVPGLIRPWFDVDGDGDFDRRDLDALIDGVDRAHRHGPFLILPGDFRPRQLFVSEAAGGGLHIELAAVGPSPSAAEASAFRSLTGLQGDLERLEHRVFVEAFPLDRRGLLEVREPVTPAADSLKNPLTWVLDVDIDLPDGWYDVAIVQDALLADGGRRSSDACVFSWRFGRGVGAQEVTTYPIHPAAEAILDGTPPVPALTAVRLSDPATPGTVPRPAPGDDLAVTVTASVFDHQVLLWLYRDRMTTDNLQRLTGDALSRSTEELAYTRQFRVRDLPRGRWNLHVGLADADGRLLDVESVSLDIADPVADSGPGPTRIEPVFTAAVDSMSAFRTLFRVQGSAPDSISVHDVPADTALVRGVDVGSLPRAAVRVTDLTAAAPVAEYELDAGARRVLFAAWRGGSIEDTVSHRLAVPGPPAFGRFAAFLDDGGLRLDLATNHSAFDSLRVRGSADIALESDDFAAAEGLSARGVGEAFRVPDAGHVRHVAAALYRDGRIVDFRRAVVGRSNAFVYHGFPTVALHLPAAFAGLDLDGLAAGDVRVLENDLPQLDGLILSAPGSGDRAVDVVFVVDNGGAMGPVQDGLGNNLRAFVEQLQAAGADVALGLSRFGLGGVVVEDGGLLTDDVDVFLRDLWPRNEQTGPGGSSLRAIAESARGVAFRPGARRVLVVVSDATPTGAGSVAGALRAVTANAVTLFAWTDRRFFDVLAPLTSRLGGADVDILGDAAESLLGIADRLTDTYVVGFEASDRGASTRERLVKVLIDVDGEALTFSGSYLPGSTPRVERTRATLGLHARSHPPGAPARVSVAIRDDVVPGVRSATLFFRTAGDDAYRSVPMTAAGDREWTAAIDAGAVQPPGVDYYFVASDGNSTIADPSVRPREAPYQLAVLPAAAPVFEGVEVAAAGLGQVAVVRARIVGTGQLSARLHYRVPGQRVYESTAMGRAGDSFEAAVLGGFVTDAGLEYYIRAVGEDGIGSLSGSADEPQRVALP